MSYTRKQLLALIREGKNITLQELFPALVNSTFILDTDTSAWSNNRSYPQGYTVVDPNTGIQYVATRDTKPGIVLTNRGYWNPISPSITPYTVGPNSSYGTIQEAIDAAYAAGKTGLTYDTQALISIEPGDYIENLTIQGQGYALVCQSGVARITGNITWTSSAPTDSVIATMSNINVVGNVTYTLDTTAGRIRTSGCVVVGDIYQTCAEITHLALIHNSGDYTQDATGGFGACFITNSVLQGTNYFDINFITSISATLIGQVATVNVEFWGVILGCYIACDTLTNPSSVISLINGTVIIFNGGSPDGFTYAATSTVTMSGVTIFASGLTNLTDGNTDLIGTYTVDGNTVAITNQSYTYNIGGQFISKTQTLVDAANIGWNTSLGPNAEVTITANRQLDNPVGIRAGGYYRILIIQDAVGGWTITWDMAYKFTAATPPVLTAAANARDLITFYSPDGVEMIAESISLNV